MNVLIRECAYEDLRRIHDWIAGDNPFNATKVIDKIVTSIERLGTFPGIGHEGQVGSTLEWVVVGLPYIIVYAIDQGFDELQVVAVMHGAQLRD